MLVQQVAELFSDSITGGVDFWPPPLVALPEAACAPSGAHAGPEVWLVCCWSQADLPKAIPSLPAGLGVPLTLLGFSSLRGIICCGAPCTPKGPSRSCWAREMPASPPLPVPSVDTLTTRWMVRVSPVTCPHRVRILTCGIRTCSTGSDSDSRFPHGPLGGASVGT